MISLLARLVTPGRGMLRRLVSALCLTAFASVMAGCASDSTFAVAYDNLKQKIFKQPEAPPPPVDSFVMRGGGLEKDKELVPGSPQAELEGAKTLYTQGKYADAEKIFHRIANKAKNPYPVVEEALFFEGDCLYMQGHYPKAEGTFKKLLKDFRLNGRYHEQATKRVFDIANYWLDDTRRNIKAEEARRAGKSWFVLPASYIHFEKEKPLLDEEGRAVGALEEVRLNDINGPMGEKALFYIATIKFFRKDYKEADYYYRQVLENYPNGAQSATALKHSIICEQMMTGGSAYDLRVLEKARKLILEQARAYPELNKESEFLERNLVSIARQQADRDWSIGEFYNRTGHPGAAYFYYELVKRRYPGTSYSEKAIKRMADTKKKLDRMQQKGSAGSAVDFSTPPRPFMSAPSNMGMMPGMMGGGR